MENQIKNLTKIIKKSSLLSNYIDKTRELEQLTTFVRQYLDPELRKNCFVANIVNNVLILATTSSTWNHKLRFLAPDLLIKLRSSPNYYGLTNIKVIPLITNNLQDYSMFSHINQHNSLKKPTLSKQNATQIKLTASQLTNKNLAKALIKLAKQAEK